MSINLSAMTNMGPLNLMLVDIYGKLYILQNIGYVAVRGKSIDAMSGVKQTFQKQQNNSFPRNRNADHICNTNLVTVFLCLISGKSLACPTTLIKSNVQYCRNLISIESK